MFLVINTRPSDPTFCSAPHPDPRYTERRRVQGFDDELGQVVKRERDVPSVRCRRLAGHDGEHRAYTFLISEPETWQWAPPLCVDCGAELIPATCVGGKELCSACVDARLGWEDDDQPSPPPPPGDPAEPQRNRTA